VRQALLCCVLLPACMASAASLTVASQNTLRLSQRASQLKHDTFKDQNGNYDVNLYQEVMKTADLDDVLPGNYTFEESPLQGHSSYKETYGIIFKNTLTPVVGDTVDYPDANNDFSRPPCGSLLEDGSGNKIFFVDYHAIFGKSPSVREAEIEEMGTVYTWFSTNSGQGQIDRVVIAGDWNMDADDDSFDNLKAIGTMEIEPNVESSLTKSGDPSEPYDHLAADATHVQLSNCVLIPLPNNMDEQEFRDDISDHRGIECTITY